MVIQHLISHSVSILETLRQDTVTIIGRPEYHDFYLNFVKVKEEDVDGERTKQVKSSDNKSICRLL